MGSTRTSPSEGGGTGGSFKCDFPRCNKTFTRKDHLIRHQANHSTTTFPCPICGRLFKRLDLLQRHEKRNICGEAGPSTTPRRLTPSNTGGKSLPKQMQKPQKRKRSPSSSSSSSGSSDGVSSPVQLLTDKAGLELINGWNRAQDEEEDGWGTSVREMLPPPFGRVSDLGQGIELERLLARSKAHRGKREDINVSRELILRLQADFSGYDDLFTDAEKHIAHFFSSFAPSFPIIHRPTFDPNSVATPSHLIVLIIVLGSVTSSCSTPTSGQSSPDSSELVHTIRTDLFNKLGSEVLEIEVLQTLSLCHIYEYHFAPPDRADQTNKRSMARRDKAGLWWAGVVAHLTRQGIGVTDTQELEDGDAFGNGETGQEGEVGRLWRRWVKQEARLRLAYTILHLDLLTPLYTHHPPSRPYPFISYDLPLPASRALWDCPTAEEWVQLYSLSRRDRSNGKSSTHNQADDLPGGIVSVLRGMMSGPKGMPGVVGLKVDLDHAFAVRSVVLGLIGIGWDCKVYGPHMYPATEESEGDKPTAKRWRKGIQDAVIHLRATWEGATQHLPSCTEIRDMRDLFGISILSVLSDIPMLLGMNTSPPSPTATTRAQVWVKTDDAFTCLWQSARYLKQALFADWGTYTAEVVYLSTLVLYVYATCSLPASIQAFSSSSPSKGTHTLLDSILISNSKPHLAGRHILDLLTCSAEMLSTKSYPRLDPALPRVLKGLIGKHIVADGAEDEDVGSCIRDMGLLAELLPESLLPTSLDFVSKKDLGVGTTDVSER